MGAHGPQHKPPSAEALVRYGMTHRQRIMIAKRDRRMMESIGMEDMDADTRNAICILCDNYKQKYGEKK